MSKTREQPSTTEPMPEPRWDVYCPEEGYEVISGFDNIYDARKAAKEHNFENTPHHKARAVPHHYDPDEPPHH